MKDLKIIASSFDANKAFVDGKTDILIKGTRCVTYAADTLIINQDNPIYQLITNFKKDSDNDQTSYYHEADYILKSIIKFMPKFDGKLINVYTSKPKLVNSMQEALNSIKLWLHTEEGQSEYNSQSLDDLAIYIMYDMGLSATSRVTFNVILNNLPKLIPVMILSDININFKFNVYKFASWHLNELTEKKIQKYLKSKLNKSRRELIEENSVNQLMAKNSNFITKRVLKYTDDDTTDILNEINSNRKDSVEIKILRQLKFAFKTNNRPKFIKLLDKLCNDKTSPTLSKSIIDEINIMSEHYKEN